MSLFCSSISTRVRAGAGRLATIRLSYGEADSYDWIPAGTAYFDDLLTEKGVDHSLRTFDGGHSIDDAFYDDDFVAFFTEQFAGAA